jgi:8-oxo-dGTP pyrophosphatase MutT (NUDIX family)
MEAAAGLCIWIRARNEVFLVLRGDLGSFVDHWGVVGGAIDPNETPLQAAYREAEEELGSLPIGNVLAKCTTQSSVSFTTYLYEVKPEDVDGWEATLNEENREAHFFSVDNLPSPLVPGALESFSLLGIL